MPDGKRIFQRMEQTKAGWGWSDLDAVYRAFGFECDEGGNHTEYTHPKHPELTATVKRHPGEFPKGYAQRAVKLIRTLIKIEATEADEAGEETDNARK